MWLGRRGDTGRGNLECSQTTRALGVLELRPRRGRDIEKRNIEGVRDATGYDVVLKGSVRVVCGHQFFVNSESSTCVGGAGPGSGVNLPVRCSAQSGYSQL